MKPLYFCNNCKQYHAACTKGNLGGNGGKTGMGQSSSIKYLRFAELFCGEKPRAHLQNFTVNSPRMPESWRLVYEGDGRPDRGRSKDMANHSMNRDSRVTTDDRPSSLYTQHKNRKKMHTTISISIPKPKKNPSSSHLKTNPDSNKKLQFSYPKQPQKKSRVLSIHDNDKGPYYVISRINRNQQSAKISRTQDTTLLTEKKTPTKSSYVYGDSNRKILIPTQKVKEFSYGELAQSREEEELPFMRPGKTAKRNGDGRVVEHVIRVDQESEEKRNEQSKVVGSYDYAQKMSELKQLLKSNEKNYLNEGNVERPPKPQGEKPGGPESSQQPKRKITPASNTKLLSSAQRMQAHEKAKTNQAEKCRYFDNRCLGFSFCDEGEINFIQGMQDLL